MSKMQDLPKEYKFSDGKVDCNNCKNFTIAQIMQNSFKMKCKHAIISNEINL